jgi:predicted RNase H-like nuclease (RuvC/YqgF family)
LVEERHSCNFEKAMSPKFKAGAAVALLLAFAGLLGLQQQKIKHLVAENGDLRSQLAQMTSVQESNEALAQQLKAAIAASQTNQNELLRLRGQGPRLRQLEQENAQLKSERQQLALKMQQTQAAVASSEQGQVTAVSEVAKATAASAPLDTTDLGSLELQSGVAIHFDLGGGTNCVVTPTALSDGNNTMQIKVGVTNADGTFSELGVSRLTARPGQHCSITVGDRMIALAVTLKP